MTKKGRRASERRNSKDEPTQAARKRSKNEATAVGVDLSQLQTKQGNALEHEEEHVSLPDATQESRTIGTLSTRFGTQTQSQQMDADQAFRHAVLAVDEEMPETAIGDDISNADKSFLNAELEIISGEDADSRFQLEHYPVILGRENEACHIQLKDAAVSQTH